MTTYSAITTINGQLAAEALAEKCENLIPEPTGVGTFEVEDDSGLWEVAVYFTEEPDQAGLALLAAMHEANGFVVSEIPDQDWVAKVRRELAPVDAGRFFVYGSHDADKVPEGRVPLLIDAAMAFGTGHHGTTLGCLKAFDILLEEGVPAGKVADIGCGTAVLAMAAARVWEGVPILASDIDRVAVDVAEANVVANGLAGKVSCVEAAGFDTPALAEVAPFDLIFANILKGPLIALAPEMSAHLKSGGYIILSGILNEQADSVEVTYRANQFSSYKRTSIGDWTTLTMRKD